MTEQRLEIIREIENANVDAAWRRPDSIMERREGWRRLITPSSNETHLNGVLRSTLAPSEAEMLVMATLDDYRSRGTSFRWFLGPSSAPLDLGDLLNKHGIVERFRLDGMHLDVAQARIAVPKGVTVNEVTELQIDDYVQVCVEGWRTDPGASSAMRDDLLRTLRSGDRSLRYYLARIDGRPAASGALKIQEGTGRLIGSSAVPALRGRGAYRALVAARVTTLREERVRSAIIQAMRATSAPICCKLGFETVCELRVHHWSPPC